MRSTDVSDRDVSAAMMDARSESFFPQIEPDLVRVLRAAAQEPQPFVVIYGIRTVEAEAAACASGHSQTMHSRHLPDKNGLAAAVDIWALVDGNVDPAAGREKEVFGQINDQIQVAAKTCGVEVMWGGADIGAWEDGKVSHFHDFAHWQLGWGKYP